MIQVRFAGKGEIEQQKILWKLCFGDSDAFIDMYYAHRYRPEDTFVLLAENKIVAMLTIIPVTITGGNHTSHEAAMLYGIATHPAYRRKGFATRLMAYSYQYLLTKGIRLAMLVPAHEGLFAFYQNMGYRRTFCHREIKLTRAEIENFAVNNVNACSILPISATEYNRRRNEFLRQRIYVSYPDEAVRYQKVLSLYSQADIYALEAEGIYGCAAVERVSSKRLLVKEALLPETGLEIFLQKLLLLLPAQEVILRVPAFAGACLGGQVRPFAMLRELDKGEHIKTERKYMAADKKTEDIKRAGDTEETEDMTEKEAGYLGLGFD